MTMVNAVFNRVLRALPSSTTTAKLVLRTVCRVQVTLPAINVKMPLASLLMAHVQHHLDVLAMHCGTGLPVLVLMDCS